MYPHPSESNLLQTFNKYVALYRPDSISLEKCCRFSVTLNSNVVVFLYDVTETMLLCWESVDRLTGLRIHEFQ